MPRLRLSAERSTYNAKKDIVNIEALQLKYLTLTLPKSYLGLKLKNKK